LDRGVLQTLINKDLAPIVNRIDQDGLYPAEFLRALGSIGGFRSPILSEFGGSWTGNLSSLTETLKTMTQIGECCLSTAFAYWCHTACSRYIQLSDNQATKTRYLPLLARGTLLGGTGLSNTLKSACDIEKFLLSAQPVEGGYLVNGTLPWVSNLGQEHIFVTGCPVDADGRLVFFIVSCQQKGFSLKQGAHFTALEGTGTFACQFKNVFISDDHVLVDPENSLNYLKRIQSGMILAQLGMGFGLIRDCIRVIRRTGRTHDHINCFETHQADTLDALLKETEERAFDLAELADLLPEGLQRERLITDIMKVRLKGGELSLIAAQTAMLHQGAKGYLKNSVAQRRLRESYFVAIVTPSLKHLRREIERREHL
jgi:hypothetical protein